MINKFTTRILASALTALMLAGFMMVSIASPVSADHTVDHCEEQYLAVGGETLRAQYEACVAAIDDTEPSQEGPTREELQSQELELANEATVSIVKSNPIYTLLLDFITFLTAGVALVVTTMVVVGGVEYMTAGGNPQKTQQAIVRISNALIGLVLYLFMYAILQWLIPGGLFG